ncbi:hypothetical protein LOAG_05414 [Loa loa]|uniref:Uncharacterized protein n=1 Tax=Loa loa TaxID=7209 RepID=A0A1S0TZZ5_LOALO|nr:hypothetical protein LOAG_05414 [Loa loa]EFO23068.1 hypothetical protein LOAG_05414 [Loa loa]
MPFKGHPRSSRTIIDVALMAPAMPPSHGAVSSVQRIMRSMKRQWIVQPWKYARILMSFKVQIWKQSKIASNKYMLQKVIEKARKYLELVGYHKYHTKILSIGD